MNDYTIHELLTEGEDLEINVSRDDINGYNIEAALEYEGEHVELNLADIESVEELEGFYLSHLSQRADDPSISVYGNSKDLRYHVARKDTWGLVRSGEWSVDVLNSLEKYADEEDLESYSKIMPHVSATALSAISLSESYGQERPEDYEFYLGIIKGFEKTQKPRGIRGKIKKRAQDKAKQEAVDAAQTAKEEIEQEWRRLEREGKIEEAKQKVKEEAKKKAKQAARNIWQSAKNGVKNRAKNKALSVRQDLVGLTTISRKDSLTEERLEDEAPEPALKVEKSDGITIYRYGEIREYPDNDASEE